MVSRKNLNLNESKMKKVFFFIILVTFTTGLFAQDNSSYMMVMVKQKKAYNMARSEQDFLSLANSFERISNAESDKWHPLYYAGMCYINMSFINDINPQKDAYLDKAQTYIDKALEIYPDESELHVLQALLYQGRIQIDIAQRGMSYSVKANEALERAKEYNPENPRVYYLSGLNIRHTPLTYGGGVDSACKLFKTAMEKYKTYRPEHVLSPTWGGERNQRLYNENCVDQN